jgi:nitrite reductase (NADH) large subunit
VHRGPEPPDVCPVCGSTRENFEPYVEKAPPAPASGNRQWRCLICGYEHAGAKPPGQCPVCSASANEFEPSTALKPATTRDNTLKTVILGAGIAGVSAAETLGQSAPHAEIVLLSKEPGLPYYRLNLTRLLAGEIAPENLPIHPAEWYTEQRIDLRTETEATALDLDARKVLLKDGSTESFDKLIITCGAHAFVPPMAGSSREGVSALRTVRDAQYLLDAARPGAKCVCIGGGILGLEAAAGLALRGMEVTVLEGADWLLPRQLDPRGAEVLCRFVIEKGLSLRFGAKITEIAGDERARAVVLADGSMLDADLVLIAAGVRSNNYLARTAGLNVNQGIVVDTHLATSHPDVYAAGDVAEHNGVVYGIWEPARFQGVIAAMNAAGIETEFGGMPRANTLKVLGADMFSIGLVMPPDGSYDEIAEEIDGKYYRFLFHDTKLIGAIFVGDTRRAVAATNAIKSRKDFSGLLPQRPNIETILQNLD